MIDVDVQIREVARVVGSREERRTVTVSRRYDTSVEDLWDACTSAERIPRWFLPVSGDLRVGGRYQLEGNAGGVVERCDPPHSFAATWEYGGEVSWIEVRFVAVPGSGSGSGSGSGGARLELEHIASVDDSKWAEFGPGAVGVGWDLGLIGLGLHLEAGPGAEVDVDREAVAAWMGSPDGVRFMTESAAAWGEAAVAAGEDPDAAKAAAGRTAAAYTGTG